jgi:hypothetical protein
VTYEDILKRINQALKKFAKSIPSAQQSIYDAIIDEVNRLELSDGKIRPTVKNLSILSAIRSKINRVVLTDEYKEEVKDFAKAFNDITKLQNEYWRSIEKKFTPRPLLKEIRKQAITDVVSKLTEAGIGANVSDRIVDILRTNITTGGSYKDLAKQLRDGLLNTDQQGYLDKYAKQVTVDSINQYNAQYTQIVSSDLGYTWFKYDNTEIDSSRPFCQHMCEDHRYFHISSVPNLLKGLDISGNRMTYKDNKTGDTKTVRINPKTNLPDGFIPGTNPENFFVRRGGFSCGHQVMPVAERQVPENVKQAVYATSAYKTWAAVNVR